ncbi:amino acid transporter [Rhodococcus sp. PAMC28707]|uniref:amino acid permease n=1 Tax=unclassified Rhodococcus (in: high G+C Gram-positive bacteria) TaxID=192944 RepID=UPI00109DD6C1|nr:MULTISPECIES: amino acid transporter [unclassified Rhodococcus (in: high G+C Gram-positive bacteria)]QCB52538.1 amino acid transporter [Rhodococcus sp. PAMC28705]QCB60912.1 amino acid transporter [Rhodococcus sp. PAMC28707]
MVRLRAWLLSDITEQPSGHLGPYRKPTTVAHTHPWWKVMCLTGVDYFSTLGYQPGIAALAAGTLAPLATVVLILLTLFGALPVYRRVARESPNGEGSIAMLERLMPKWSGKLFVLVLLGFAATDFLITMTLSAADASAHVIENPFAPTNLGSAHVLITLALLALLAAVFLKGFTEAMGIAVVLVGTYLALNIVVIGMGFYEIAKAPSLITDWQHAMTAEHGNPLMMIAVALIVFPKLALGLSGFETGVAVMPQIDGGDKDELAGRIRGAKRLLTSAALIMSGFLLTSSIVTTVLIPENEFDSGGQANGRALAFLAHEYLGSAFGTIYDVSTIAILWFAGASALAGLLNLVPRYLPKYGMAPEWARAIRPLVLVFSVIAFVVTIYFKANVDAQSAAYATGVLVLITSASVAVTLSAARHGQRGRVWLFAIVATIFVYTTVANIFERPDGVKVASFFIVTILVVSFWSRVSRSFELRTTSVVFDEVALRFIEEAAARGSIQVVCHDSRHLDLDEYEAKEARQRKESSIPSADPIMFLEANVEDASEFSTDLLVHGRQRGQFRVLWVDAVAVPNSIAAVLLKIRDTTGVKPDAYFEWSEGNPLANLVSFLFLGVGEVAPVTREVLRRAEPDIERRPNVHVG